MAVMRWCALALPLVLGLLYLADQAAGCNEAVCASLVSKCMLLKSCECNMADKKNCTCCKTCHKCLAKLYTECCSCVGMCPESDQKHNRDKMSSVEEIKDPIPDLFDVLTEEEDPYLRWTTHSYPAHLDLLYFKPPTPGNSPFKFSSNLGPEDGIKVQHGKHQVYIDPNSDVQNCTVAYMSQCMSLGKCRVSCQSMGAARYRWFHDQGCCECIGSRCLQYGKGEALCLQCPLKDGATEDEDDEGYGEPYGVKQQHTEWDESESKQEEEVDQSDTEDVILTDSSEFGQEDTTARYVPMGES